MESGFVSVTEKCRLHIAVGASCGPTAVAAATGAAAERVEAAIYKAANEDAEYPTHLDDSNFRHQARAAELSGFDLYDLAGSPMRASAIVRELKISIDQFQQLPPITKFLAENKCKDVLICNAITISGVAHTFAADQNAFFDNNTSGKIFSDGNVPQGLEDFRVVRAVALRMRETPTVASDAHPTQSSDSQAVP
jgi:hypothetical protein